MSWLWSEWTRPNIHRCLIINHLFHGCVQVCSACLADVLLCYLGVRAGLVRHSGSCILIHVMTCEEADIDMDLPAVNQPTNHWDSCLQRFYFPTNNGPQLLWLSHCYPLPKTWAPGQVTVLCLHPQIYHRTLSPTLYSTELFKCKTNKQTNKLNSPQTTVLHFKETSSK